MLDERPSSACGTFSPQAGRRKDKQRNRCRSLSSLPACGENVIRRRRLSLAYRETNQRLNRRVRRWKKPGFLCVAAGAGVAAGVVGREPLSASRARALPFERGVALPEAAPLSCGFIPADLVS